MNINILSYLLLKVNIEFLAKIEKSIIVRKLKYFINNNKLVYGKIRGSEFVLYKRGIFTKSKAFDKIIVYGKVNNTNEETTNVVLEVRLTKQTKWMSYLQLVVVSLIVFYFAIEHSMNFLFIVLLIFIVFNYLAFLILYLVELSDIKLFLKQFKNKI